MALDPKHKKLYGVYHYDTFDADAIFLKDFLTFETAEDFILSRYGDRLNKDGADKVNIVKLDNTVLKSFSIR